MTRPALDRRSFLKTSTGRVPVGDGIDLFACTPLDDRPIFDVVRGGAVVSDTAYRDLIDCVIETGPVRTDR